MTCDSHFTALRLTYFPQLPDEFKDFAGKFVGSKKLTRELLAHCHRELIHEQWKCILDDDFLFARDADFVVDNRRGNCKFIAELPNGRFVSGIIVWSSSLKFRGTRINELINRLNAISLPGTPHF